MEQTNYVSYLRQSTKKQSLSNLGIEAQREIIHKYLGQIKPIAEFVETESGKRTDRPKLAEALELCRKTKSTLIVAKLDRPLKLRITQQDLDFAELIGDFLYYMQIRQYGTQIKNALENQSKDFIPMERKSRHDGLYEKLPENFTVQDMMSVYGISNTAARSLCARLIKRGFITRLKQGSYQKIVK